MIEPQQVIIFDDPDPIIELLQRNNVKELYELQSQLLEYYNAKLFGMEYIDEDSFDLIHA